VRALVCYLCVHQHLPVDRAAQLLADVLGASVATGTLAAVVAEAAAGLGAVLALRRHPRAVRRAPAPRAGGVAEGPGQGWAAGMAELLVDAKLACDRARAAGAGRVEGAVVGRLRAR
jgi:hypothetical protein